MTIATVPTEPGGSRARRGGHGGLTWCVAPAPPAAGVDLARVPGRDLAQILRGRSPEDARAFDAGLASRALWGARRLRAASRLFVNVTAATLQAALEGAPWPRPPHRLPGTRPSSGRSPKVGPARTCGGSPVASGPGPSSAAA